MRIIETQGITIREASLPDEQTAPLPASVLMRNTESLLAQQHERLSSPEDDGEDQSPYPGEYNIWVCYGAAPCERCLENAAAGPVRAGDPFPSGDTAPPAHDRCNCGLEAVEPGILVPPIYRRKGERAIDYGTRQGK